MLQYHTCIHTMSHNKSYTLNIKYTHMHTHKNNIIYTHSQLYTHTYAYKVAKFFTDLKVLNAIRST